MAQMMLCLVLQPSIKVPAAVREPFTCGTGTTRWSFLTLMAQSPSKQDPAVLRGGEVQAYALRRPEYSPQSTQSF